MWIEPIFFSLFFFFFMVQKIYIWSYKQKNFLQKWTGLIKPVGTNQKIYRSFPQALWTFPRTISNLLHLCSQRFLVPSALSPLFASLLTSVLLGSLRGGFLEPVPFHFPSRLQQGRSISLGERQEEEPKPSNFQKTYLKLMFLAILSFYKIGWNYWMCSEALTRAWHMSTQMWFRGTMLL